MNLFINKTYILPPKAGGLVARMNNNDKLVIDLLRRRMETHPNEPMNYYGTPYKPAEMIDEIERQTEAGKGLVKEIVDEVWADKIRNLRISGWTGGTKRS